jgi:hypothetical protein
MLAISSRSIEMAPAAKEERAEIIPSTADLATRGTLW